MRGKKNTQGKCDTNKMYCHNNINKELNQHITPKSPPLSEPLLRWEGVERQQREVLILFFRFTQISGPFHFGRSDDHERQRREPLKPVKYAVDSRG